VNPANQLQGLQGVAYVGGAAATVQFTGFAGGFQCLQETVVASVVVRAPSAGAASFVAQTFPAGLFVPGEFTEINLTSGHIAVPLLKTAHTIG